MYVKIRITLFVCLQSPSCKNSSSILFMASYLPKVPLAAGATLSPELSLLLVKFVFLGELWLVLEFMFAWIFIYELDYKLGALIKLAIYSSVSWFLSLLSERPML